MWCVCTQGVWCGGYGVVHRVCGVAGARAVLGAPLNNCME